MVGGNDLITSKQRMTKLRSIEVYKITFLVKNIGSFIYKASTTKQYGIIAGLYKIK